MAGLDSRFQLAFPLQEMFLDKETGEPLAAGVVTFYMDSNRSTLMPVYTISGSYPNYTYVQLSNPLTLSSIGTFVDGSGNDIIPYLFPFDGTPTTSQGIVTNYYITVYNSAGTLQFTRQAWPNATTASTSSSNPNYNYIRNGVFYAWDNGTTFNNVLGGSTGLTDFMLNDWTYTQNDTTQTINITQGVFTPGQTVVPGCPPYYLDYKCTSIGSGLQTSNQLSQTLLNVQTLNGQNIAFDLWANQVSGGSAPLSVSITQAFGSGGSTSVVTSGTLTAGMTVGNWTQYFVTFTLPAVTGKTIGSGSQLVVSINFPLNTVCEVGISNVRLRQSTTLSGFQEISNDDTKRLTNFISLYPPFGTGDVKHTYKSVADIGWLMLDDSSIGNPSSGAGHIGWAYFNLYTTLWNNVSNTYAPVSGGRGANAAADWAANKTLTLCAVLGRALGVAGAGSGLTSRALGQPYGFETVSLSAANNGPHTHIPTFSIVDKPNAAAAGVDVPTPINIGDPGAAFYNPLTLSIGSSGSGTPHENMPPESFLNAMIKL